MILGGPGTGTGPRGVEALEDPLEEPLEDVREGGISLGLSSL